MKTQKSLICTSLSKRYYKKRGQGSFQQRSSAKPGACGLGRREQGREEFVARHDTTRRRKCIRRVFLVRHALSSGHRLVFLDKLDDTNLSFLALAVGTNRARRFFTFVAHHRFSVQAQPFFRLVGLGNRHIQASGAGAKQEKEASTERHWLGTRFRRRPRPAQR